LAREIVDNGGQAVGISTDLGNPDSVRQAFARIAHEFGHEGSSDATTPRPIAAAVFNASGRFVRKPLLELTLDEFAAGHDVSV
jgi:NAD(P)-dependent dehydrogenase (short-subunit alcohol dehydrogenase family)